MRGAVWAAILGGAFSLLATSALAADRHVYLDTDNDGTLNDCPNPIHNAFGTSNANDLQYCNGGTSTKKVIGTTSGHVTSSTCTSGGGTVTNVTNGVQIDVDGDGTNEFVYGHPQACVWNMASGASDTCEVHAGTYRKPGFKCDEKCGDQGNGGGSGSSTDLFDGYTGILMTPGKSGGFGASGNPAFLRGAVMKSSTDTWDTNGNKKPDVLEGVTSYPAVLSGDTNADGVIQSGDCTSGSCNVDSWAAIFLGCQGPGGGGQGNILCRGVGGYGSGNHGPMIDTDANGSFETELNAAQPLPINYFTIKDLEFSGFNGGNNAGLTNGNRGPADGSIGLAGDGNPTGIAIDHIYWHNSAYNIVPGERYWGIFQNHSGKDCGSSINDHIDVGNSFIVQQNEKIWVDDTQANTDSDTSHCALYLHDNRILVDVNPGGDADTAHNPTCRNLSVVVYTKPVHVRSDGIESRYRIYNNEFVIKNGCSGQLFDLQGFGNVAGQGEIWVYGNLFRNHSSLGSNWSSIVNHQSCGAGTAAWEAKMFNNTFDINVPINKWCTATGKAIVEKNNAFFRVTSVHASATSTTPVRANEICSQSGLTSCTTPASVTRQSWFSTSATVDEFSGLTAYTPLSGGPLLAIATGNPCDPDGDGTAGVDYNGDGVNDTTWRDIAGSTVSCPTSGTPLTIGAIQVGGVPSDTVPPGAVQGVRRTDDHIP